MSSVAPFDNPRPKAAKAKEPDRTEQLATWVPVTLNPGLKEGKRTRVCRIEKPDGVTTMMRDDVNSLFIVNTDAGKATITFADLDKAINSPAAQPPKATAKKAAVQVELNTFPAAAIRDARRGLLRSLRAKLLSGHNDNLLLGDEHSLTCSALCAAVGGLLVQ